MTRTELDDLAHATTYAAFRAVIEALPCKAAPEIPGPVVWYDITERVRDATERQMLDMAIRYLTGRGLLLRHRDLPYLVMVMPERKDGAVMAYTLEPMKASA